MEFRSLCVVELAQIAMKARRTRHWVMETKFRDFLGLQECLLQSNYARFSEEDNMRIKCNSSRSWTFDYRHASYPKFLILNSNSKPVIINSHHLNHWKVDADNGHTCQLSACARRGKTADCEGKKQPPTVPVVSAQLVRNIDRTLGYAANRMKGASVP